MAQEEENTKAVIDNSDSNTIEEYDREINRLEEIERTLGKKFLYHPTKEFLALDLCKFLEDFPTVKTDIEDFIRYRLRQLRMDLHNKAMSQRYHKRVIELEQQLEEKGGKE